MSTAVDGRVVDDRGAADDAVSAIAQVQSVPARGAALADADASDGREDDGGAAAAGSSAVKKTLFQLRANVLRAFTDEE
jgi:hypothetical protein